VNLDIHSWLLVGHLIGVVLWIAGLSTVFWILRIHTQSPPAVHDKLILMERSLALVMDLAAMLAIGCGLGLAFHQTPHIFARPGAGWFHIKLTIVVLGILSMHGMIRAKVGKFSRGESPSVAPSIWMLQHLSIVGIMVMVFRGPIMFAPDPPK
jgi:uncharacterized membrane protein